MMYNLNIRPMVLLMACLCLLMAISCVSASEISDMNNVSSIDDGVSSGASVSPLDQVCGEELVADDTFVDGDLAADDVCVGGDLAADDVCVGGDLAAADDSEVLIDGKSVPVTIDDLFDEISNLKSGDVYDIYRDYSCPSRALVIGQDNIRINGNGHTIDVRECILNESIFLVKADNVTINGLTLLDKDNLRSGSLITWTGDNGVLTDSVLIGNVAEFGGALNWTGSYGIIDCNEFKDNSALYAGGAIFIGGVCNNISNCHFVNCGSKLANEAVYIDRTRKNFTFVNSVFENCQSLVDGFVNDIDLSYLTTRQCVVGVADEYLNLYPLLYAADMREETIRYNDDIYYYANFDDKTGEFLLTIVKEFGEFDISYSKTFVFKNMLNDTLNDLFVSLSHEDYENRFLVEKTAYVGNGSDYTDVMQKFYSSDFINPISDILNRDLQDSNWADKDLMSYTLNVIFTKSLTIDCDHSWDLKSSPFDNLYIDGCGSVIRGSFKDRDEDKWVTLECGNKFYAYNITLEGFNTAVENMGGACVFTNVTFHKNKMDYITERDWGAAILNIGHVTCIDCTFIENYAKHGGAIFNQGFLEIVDCLFCNNTAYGQGPDICVGDGGEVIYDGENINETGQIGEVHFAKGKSAVAKAINGVFLTVGQVVGSIVGSIIGMPYLGGFIGLVVGADLDLEVGLKLVDKVVNKPSIPGGPVHYNWANLNYKAYFIIGGALDFIVPSGISGITYYYTND